MNTYQRIHDLLVEAKKGKKVNPWAVCTTSVGRSDKDKYERCVMDVKKKQGIKESSLIVERGFGVKQRKIAAGTGNPKHSGRTNAPNPDVGKNRSLAAMKAAKSGLDKSMRGERDTRTPEEKRASGFASKTSHHTVTAERRRRHHIANKTEQRRIARFQSKYRRENET